MTHYNAHVETELRKPPAGFMKDPDDLIEQFEPYDGSLGMDPVSGLFSVRITVPADTLPQAAVTAVAVVESLVGAAVIGLELMTDAEFDRRQGWDAADDRDELLTTAQAAELLGTSRQAVGQRLNSGTLVGERRGRDWLISRGSIEAEVRRRRGVADAVSEAKADAQRAVDAVRADAQHAADAAREAAGGSRKDTP